MKEKVFVDTNGEELVVQHRKSAVFFLRKTDLNIEGYVSKFWTDQTPIVNPKEVERDYLFSEEVFRNLVEYLEEIAHESWKSFVPKEAESDGADYFEYYDREHDNNGYLRISVKERKLVLEGPSQSKTTNPMVRLYKFNKPKFQSLVWDLTKNM